MPSVASRVCLCYYGNLFRLCTCKSCFLPVYLLFSKTSSKFLSYPIVCNWLLHAVLYNNDASRAQSVWYTVMATRDIDSSAPAHHDSLAHVITWKSVTSLSECFIFCPIICNGPWCTVFYNNDAMWSYFLGLPWEPGILISLRQITTGTWPIINSVRENVVKIYTLLNLPVVGLCLRINDSG